MVGPRIKNTYIDPFAVACPKCLVGVDEPCRDLRSQTGRMFGRRTHLERIKKNREVGVVTYTSQYARWPEAWTISTSSTTTLAVDTTWTNWISSGTAGTTYTTVPYDRVWQEWNRTMVPRRIVQPTQADWEQERREMESRRVLRQAQLAEQAERRVVAEARSLELLRMILSTEQNRELIESQRITVLAPSGRRYRVETHNHTVHGNVVEIDEHGCPLRRGCVQPSMWDRNGPMPTADGWVGQVLAIQHNEELLRATANWSQVRSCQNPDVPILERAA